VIQVALALNLCSSIGSIASAKPCSCHTSGSTSQSTSCSHVSASATLPPKPCPAHRMFGVRNSRSKMILFVPFSGYKPSYTTTILILTEN